MKNQQPFHIVPYPTPRIHNFKSLEGQVFGRLTILGYAGRLPSGQALWICYCECKTLTVVAGVYLRRRSAPTRSCGCLMRDRNALAHTIHGESRNRKATPELRALYDAKGRCSNPNDTGYQWYGARGIECRLHSVQDIIDHIGRRPTSRHSLDRIDNEGHYEIGNIQWATPKEQANNRRSRWR